MNSAPLRSQSSHFSLQDLPFPTVERGVASRSSFRSGTRGILPSPFSQGVITVGVEGREGGEALKKKGERGLSREKEKGRFGPCMPVPHCMMVYTLHRYYCSGGRWLLPFSPEFRPRIFGDFLSFFLESLRGKREFSTIHRRLSLCRPPRKRR